MKSYDQFDRCRCYDFNWQVKLKKGTRNKCHVLFHIGNCYISSEHKKYLYANFAFYITKYKSN